MALLNFNAKPLAFINTIKRPHVSREENYHTTHFTLGPNESSAFPIISRKNLQKKIKQKRSFSITASKYTNVRVHKVITFHKSHILNKIIQVKASQNFVTLQHNLGLICTTPPTTKCQIQVPTNWGTPNFSYNTVPRYLTHRISHLQ